MTEDFVDLININKYEVLRYLEYKGQDINDNLNSIIDECRTLTKEKINPRYISRVYSIKRYISSDNKDDNFIQLDGTNLKLYSRDICELLKNSDECILMACTLGIEIEKEIRKYSYTDLTKGIIVDSCATTAIEEVCDLVQEKVEKGFLEEGKYITTRYSPGYGDLSIDKNEDIINLLNAQKEIGLTITESKIMIPRKSVVAIIGVTNSLIKQEKKSCKSCKNYSTCKFKREVDGCGYKNIHRG